MLARNLEIGDVVDLQFVLNALEIRVQAAVRNRTDARYGFEFLTLGAQTASAHSGRYLASLRLILRKTDPVLPYNLTYRPEMAQRSLASDYSRAAQEVPWSHFQA